MSQFIEMFKDVSCQVPLEDVVTIKDDCRKPINDGVRSTMKTGDLYPYYGATGVVDYINDYITDEQLLCIAEDCGNYKAGEESSYIIKGKAWVNNHAHIVKPKESCSIEYLHQYLKITNLLPYVSGTTRLKLTQKKLKEIPVILPSKERQSQFVTITNQADKSEFDGFKSQFIEMFGTVESTKPLTNFIEVSFPGEWGQEDKDGSGVKVIRTTNFTNNGKLDLSDVVTRDIDSAKVEKKKLSKGDIILERSGGTNENPVGRVVYFEEDGEYLVNNFTQLLRCKEGVNSLFIFYSLFNYYQMNKNVIRSMGNKTTGIQNLKMDRYWQIPIADVRLERQKEFESIYRQADKSESVLDNMKNVSYN